MLQHLLLSLNLMDMSQLSECLSLQVDLQLQGINKSLAEIIIEQGHTTQEYIQNLRYLRGEDGTSLLPGYEIIKNRWPGWHYHRISGAGCGDQ